MRFPFILFLSISSFILYSCNQNSSHVSKIPKIIVEDSIINEVKDSIIAIEVIDSIYDVNYYEYPVLDSAAVGINFKEKGTYTGLKNKMKRIQQEIKKEYILLDDSIRKRQFRDSVSLLLTDILINDFFPFWYGTDWDYEGITETPGEGSVACGYFVSTTLKHLYFNLNRYKLAQQSGLNGAKTIQMGAKIRKFYPSANKDITEVLRLNLKEGLYQVGLSCHVGYMLIRNNEVYFIHSNYLHSGVMIERAADSDAFVSNIYVISDITFNDKLTEKWILHEFIPIIKS
jgi:hypothetical protein